VLLLFLRLGQDVHKDGGCAYCQDENGQLWMGRPHRTCQAEHPCSGSDCARQQRSLQGLHRNSSSGIRLAVNSGYAKRSQCVPWKMPVSWRKIAITLTSAAALLREKLCSHSIFIFGARLDRAADRRGHFAPGQTRIQASNSLLYAQLYPRSFRQSAAHQFHFSIPHDAFKFVLRL
jgi:hypothetical protein